MKNSGKKLFVATAVLAVCIVLLSSSTSIEGRDKKTYEIRPEITLPEHKTDTTRFIESYERILQRLITNERSRINLTDDVSGKLESMDKKLDNILTRLGKIEKALNIDKKTTISIDNNTDHQDNEIDDD